ncbi:MAG TPA: SRPBCC family protein [Verrucomicrobiota bacterium]|nr:SRPBCC family protein [Verrucomicrobiota bacterium]
MIPVLLAIAVLVILLIVVIAGQPDEFKVARSAAIAATPQKVFSHVNELRKWEDWSPWAKLDPDAKSAFEGPDSGVGSAMSWSGNRKVGEGKMTITESAPASFIQFRLEFLRPFKATNTAEFVFAPRGDQTSVTWSMAGKNNFMGKVFSLFFNCDTMVGKDFEKGLARLKAVAEAGK